ncbi:MAG: prepilin-type N-terminal cleavage/methylation domain-containing protein [Candidatus Brocadiia bacterium]
MIPRKSSGFTLIELLVVMAIIAIAATIAWMSIPTSNAVKRAGNIVSTVFMKASTLAISERAVYFISFDKEKSLMSIYRNAEEDETEGEEKLDKKTDIIVGEQIQLPKGVKFSKTTPLFQQTETYVGFRPSGMMFLPQGVADKGLNPPGEADIILEQENKTGKMYIDYTILTGRVRRIVFQNN